LRKRIDAQPHFLAHVDASQVPLVDAELELQRVRAAEHEDRAAGIGPRSYAFLGASGQHHTRHRGSHCGRTQLLVANRCLASKHVGAQALQSLFRRITATRRARRRSLGYLSRRNGRIVVRSQLGVTKLDDRSATLDDRPLPDQHALDDPIGERPDLGSCGGPKHRRLCVDAKWPANERERADCDQRTDRHRKTTLSRQSQQRFLARVQRA
jgi:hypothetical protein